MIWNWWKRRIERAAYDKAMAACRALRDTEESIFARTDSAKAQYAADALTELLVDLERLRP